MLPATSIAPKPVKLLLPGIRSSRPSTTTLDFTKSPFFREFVFRASASSFNSRARTARRMVGLIKPPLSWVSSGDEGCIRAFEQEACIDGSSGSRSNSAVDGIEAILNGLSKWLVAALFGIFVLWRHDAEVLWAAIGSILNSGLSNALKHILKQERPVSTLRSDPGMPSSHAQSIFFAVMFAVISMLKWLGVNGLTTALSGLILLLGSYFSWLRVSQRLHTISQVVVGAVLGSMFCIVWFWSWEAFVLTAFVSHLWVRIAIVAGAVGICVGFLLYVIRYWIRDEQQIL